MKCDDVVRLEWNPANSSVQKQLRAASEVAAKAFEDDPVLSYLTPEDRRSRLQALNWLTDKVLDYCGTHNHIYTTSDVRGVAAWLPPHQSSSDALQLLREIAQLQLYALPFKCGWNRLWRWLVFLSVTEQAHQQEMEDRPHWYLALMVVNPNSQGQGIGSALLQPVLSQASQEGLPCYLITFTERAVRFYQKNGFAVVKNRKFFRGSLPFWTLKRNP